jgi:hypothetical protein
MARENAAVFFDFFFRGYSTFLLFCAFTKRDRERRVTQTSFSRVTPAAFPRHLAVSNPAIHSADHAAAEA